MKKSLFVLLFFITFSPINAQDVLGKWKTIDDKTGEALSVVNIYEKEGKIYGDIIEVLEKADEKALCEACSGENHLKPILGMTIINNMQKDGEYYKKGTILDPQNGKVYKLRLKVINANKNKLEVRGYIGFFYATQYWIRVVK